MDDDKLYNPTASRGGRSTKNTSHNESPNKARHMRNATMATIDVASDIEKNADRFRQRSRTPGMNRPMTG
jgi:hypothetical protein